MATVCSLRLAFIFIALFYLVILAWDKKDGKYIFEWLLTRFDWFSVELTTGVCCLISRGIALRYAKKTF